MPERKKTGKCKLCGTEGPLCKSHIVPEFAYSPIKNDKGQVFAIGHNVKKVQTGYFERLLCHKCETLLSDYENKFKKMWMDTIPPNLKHLKTTPNQDLICVEIPDYDAFKLFHLSVLWRAAVSSGFKFESPDSKISLGKYESEIGRLLQNKDPGNIGDFPFTGTLMVDENKEPVTIISPLAQGIDRFDNYDYFLLSYAFCDWIFFMAHPGSQEMVNLEAKCRDKNIFILSIAPYTKSKSFKLGVDWVRKLRKYINA